MERVLDARRIRVWLAEQEWTQAQLADKAGIDETTLSRGMNGHRMGAKVLFSLSRVTGLPIEDIVKTTGQPHAADQAPEPETETAP